MLFEILQTPARSAAERVLAVTPLAMAGWSLYSVIAAFGSLAAAAVWAAGAAIALSIGLALKDPEGAREVAEEKRPGMPRRWMPLALIVGAFVVRSLFAVAMGIDPTLRESSELIFVASLGSGLLGGLFPSRAARLWKARISS